MGGAGMIPERYMVRGKRVDDEESWIVGLPHHYRDKIFIVSPEIIEIDDEYISMEYWWKVDPATVEPVAVSYESCDAGDYCPNCNHAVERWMTGDASQIGETGEWTDAVEYEMKYCANCGQRLKWEE